MDNKRKSEKERLMEEVLNKKRDFSFNTARVMQTTKEANKRINNILDREIKGLASGSFDAFEKEIEKDFGVSLKPKKSFDKDVLKSIEDNLKAEIYGQDYAINKLLVAFRRPFVMGYSHAKNVILLSGQKGTGKHTTLTMCAQQLSVKGIIDSDVVYTVDMGLYTSANQELLFMQDLFSALSSSSAIICFENFETSYPPFLKMLSDLVCEGHIDLNKRYVNQNGQLIESQSGLVKSAVSKLEIKDKYLIFITEQKLTKVTDYFGLDFDMFVLDKIVFDPLSKDMWPIVIDKQIQKLISRVNSQLNIKVVVDKSINRWLLDHYDTDLQVESIIDYMDEFYINIASMVLEHGARDIVLSCEAMPIIKESANIYKLVDEDDRQPMLETIDAELDDIVGLASVKEYIASLKSHMIIQQRRKKQGMKTSDISKHMIFTGNPGTGKTTIARLISRYMMAIGALSKGQLVEVTRADLVGKYVGHTAPLTMQVIKSAIGGVLFIDEAYSLYRGKDDSFGLEAIDTLVKAMEDNRDDLIVILAGYKKEMDAFLLANSGLKSRFPNIIEFPDYTGEELLAIAKSVANKKDYIIEEKAHDKLLKYFNEIQSDSDNMSGNGRLARNVVEDAILCQSRRLLSDESQDLNLLKEEDFQL